MNSISAELLTVRANLVLRDGGRDVVNEFTSLCSIFNYRAQY